MKVLLFVQSGDARPKVFTRYAANFSCLFARNVAFARAYPDAYTSKPLRACAEADRWWLVECESAKAGRFLIASALTCPERLEHLHGRILASGVRGESCTSNVVGRE